MNDTVLKKCYWLEKNKILAGPYPYNPGADEPRIMLRRLLDLGIDSFIDLTEEDELAHYDKILNQASAKTCIYRRFGIEDFSVPSLQLMREIQNHIAQQLASGRKIFIHCFGGIGRTGTVAGCYLVEKGMSGRAALEKLAELFKASSSSDWAVAPESDEQRNFVLNWSRNPETASG